MMHSSLTGIISSYQSLKLTEQEFVLATIVEIQGSTYRKAGARMLISRSGKYCGLLGGGCFESDLLEHAYLVFDSRQPIELFYDMRAPEDLIWGLGLGCNGAVRIWLEFVTIDQDYLPLALFETALQSRTACVCITILEGIGSDSTHTRHYLFGDSDKIPIEYSPPTELIDTATDTMSTGKPQLHEIDLDGRQVQAFFSRINLPVQLLIIGGGPDAVPVTRLARVLGWEVTLVDYRDNYCKPEKFPDAQHVIRATPEQLADRVNLDTVHAVVLMTYKYEYDLRYLQQLSHPGLRYIGLLGPTARRKEMLRTAGKELTRQIQDRVYGPVGLDIGGELPEEIACSLVAEIQAVMNQRHGGHLAAMNQESSETNASYNLGCIVLAAGGSTRFGALKQLLEFNGISLLRRCVQLACEIAQERVMVVHGPKHTKCQRNIAAYKVTNIVNEDWQSGMASSLTLAIGSLPQDYDAVLILLCDQPLIESRHIELLREAWFKHPDKIIASNYADTAGVPAIIPRLYFDQILKLTGDHGAKKILSSLASNVIHVPIPEAEFDIDTQEDFARLLFRTK